MHEGLKPFRQLGFPLLHIAKEVTLLQFPGHGETCTACEGVATKRAGVIARHKMISVLLDQ